MASTAFASNKFKSTFVPENDLWKQDKFEFATSMTKELFNHIITIGDEIFNQIAIDNNEKLIVNGNWDNPSINGTAWRKDNIVTIDVYGGTPYVYVNRRISPEGQADYFGAQTCLEKILQNLEEYPEQLLKTEYTEKVCTEKFREDISNKTLCLRKLSAGISLGALLSTVMKQGITNYETPDNTTVNKTLLSYPDTAQCRIDTYFNGIFNLERPKCWFKN